VVNVRNAAQQATTGIGRQREFSFVAESCPWPSRLSYRRTAHRLVCELTLAARRSHPRSQKCAPSTTGLKQLPTKSSHPVPSHELQTSRGNPVVANWVARHFALEDVNEQSRGRGRFSAARDDDELRLRRCTNVSKLALVQTEAEGTQVPSEAAVLPSCKHRIPHRRRIAFFESQLAEIELAFMDPAQ